MFASQKTHFLSLKKWRMNFTHKNMESHFGIVMLFDMEIYTSLDAFQWFFCITHNFLFKTVCDCVPHHTLFFQKNRVQWKANGIVKQIVHDICAICQLVGQWLFASRAFRYTTSGLKGRKISQRLCIYHAFSFRSTCMARSHSSFWYARECYKRDRQ
jgi:hypothetical protein